LDDVAAEDGHQFFAAVVVVVEVVLVEAEGVEERGVEVGGAEWALGGSVADVVGAAGAVAAADAAAG
jgi:hypothetical protein